MAPTRRPMRLPKITKYSVAVTTDGTMVWPQMRMMRPYSRMTMVWKPIQRTTLRLTVGAPGSTTLLIAAHPPAGVSRRRRDTPAGGCAAMSSVVLPGAPTVNLNVVRWIGFQTIVIREYGRIIRIWGQTIVPSVVTATLYFVIFGSLIGRRVGAMGGFDYKQYIAPGLIMMSVITNSYGNVVASFFGAKFGKHVEEMLVSPLPNWVIVAGYAAGGVVRGLLVGAAVDRKSTRLNSSH